MVILTVGNDTKLDDLHRLARDTVFSNTRSERISAQVLVYEGEFRPWFNTSTADGATIVQASREVERLRYGKHSFELFSGIYGASVKPGALRWLTQPGSSVDRLRSGLSNPTWFSPARGKRFLRSTNQIRVISSLSTQRFGTQTRRHGITGHLARTVEAFQIGKSRAALLPVFRISRNFAAAAVAHLSASTRSSGHHEAFLPTFLTVNSDAFSFRDLRPDVAYMRWRPAFDLDAVPRLAPIRRDALYHPVKSLEMYRNLSQASFEA